MELFGEKLREVRESKNYTLEQVARETRISRRYIEALESEDFAAFPGETYLIGFLRSYAEYLDLDPDHFVNLYRNIKIQEQPIPFDELLNNNRKMPRSVVVLIAGLGIVLLAGGIAALSFFVMTNMEKPEAMKDKIEDPAVLKTDEGEEFVFNDAEVLTRWFREHDRITIPLGENTYRMEILKAEEPLQLKVMDKTTLLYIGKKVSFDLNDDQKFDVTLVFNDLITSDYGNQANIGLYKITVSKPVYIAGEDGTGDGIERPSGEQKGEDEETEAAAIISTPQPAVTPLSRATQVQPTPPAEMIETEDIASNEATLASNEATLASNEASETVETGTETTIRINEETITVIGESEKREPFAVDIDFRGHCLFRYAQDGEMMPERFFSKGEDFEIENVKNEVKLWISNANSVKAKVLGKELIMGRAGQVVTKLIHWVRNESSGLYRLEIVSIY
ncbi:MAG: helix-turn-helix domain-containing protein [Spirochaetales bacterium]|nr:helix-turn-helix domain-containing protein [Spirochaetales bacterium]